MLPNVKKHVPPLRRMPIQLVEIEPTPGNMADGFAEGDYKSSWAESNGDMTSKNGGVVLCPVNSNPTDVLEAKEFSKEFYALEQFECPVCPQDDNSRKLYNIPDIVKHMLDIHKFFICVYCKSQFKWSRELVSHLIQDHHVSEQNFNNIEEFYSRGGSSLNLVCVECNQSFTSDSSKEELESHDCRKLSESCQKCGTLMATSKISEHYTQCTGSISVKPKPSNQPKPVETKTSPIRSRDNSCKKCGKNFPVSKIAAHLKDCVGKVVDSPPLRSLPTRKRLSIVEQLTALPKSKYVTEVIVSKYAKDKYVTCAICKEKISDTIYYQHLSYCRDRQRSKDGLGDQRKVKCKICGLRFHHVTYWHHAMSCEKEKLVSPQKVELEPGDPLLAEPDPAKRLDLLIDEFSTYLTEDTELEQPEKVYKVFFPGTLFEDSDLYALQALLETTAKDCLFCRQCRLIRIDKRRLVIHLLRQHRWEIRSCPFTTNIETSGKEDAKDFAKQTDTAVLPNENNASTNLASDKITGNLESDNILKKVIAVGVNLKAAANVINNNKSNSDDKEPESSQVAELAFNEKEESVTSDEAKINSEHCSPTEVTPKASNDVDRHSSSTEIVLWDNLVLDKINSTQVDWIAFQLKILQLVFHSKEFVFTYTRDRKICFHDMPGECLLCGFRAGTQHELFPHWVKSHRHIPMLCTMCYGKFLFVGGLYSHICHGTPVPYVEHHERTITDLPSRPPDHTFGYDSTPLLHYRCGICENGVNYPGFFCYMVHMRNDHIACELCLESVSNAKELEQHLKKHKLKLFCWKCGMVYVDKTNFKDHLYWKHGTESVECSVCLEKKWPHLYHFCVPPTVFTCEVCTLNFTKAKALVVHRRLHAKPDELEHLKKSGKLRKCPTCPEYFISKKLLAKHVEGGHVKTPEENTEAHIQSVPGKGVDLEVDNLAEISQLTTSDAGIAEPSPNSSQTSAETKNEGNMTASEEPQLNTHEEPLEKIAKLNDVSTAVVNEQAANDTPERDNGHKIEAKAAKQKKKKDKTRTCQTCNLSFTTKKSLKEHIQTTHATQADASVAPKLTLNLSTLQGPNLSEEEDSETDLAEDSCGSNPLTPQEPSLVQLDKEAGIKSPASPLENNTVSSPIADPIKAVETHEETKPMETGDGIQPTGSSMEISQPDSASHDDKVDEQTDNFGSMSPLLPPLEDFTFVEPEMPSFDDNVMPEHIRKENLNFCLENEHDYGMAKQVVEESKNDMNLQLKRKLSESSVTQLGHERSPKKMRAHKKQSPRKPSRRRHSSSSSSSSSSSCSSCSKSNCSCCRSSSSHSSSSSSSGSDSDGDSDSSDSNTKMKKKPKMPSPVKKSVLVSKKLESKPKKPKVVADPSTPKRPVGRPRKYPIKSGPAQKTPVAKVLVPKKVKAPAVDPMEEILKHFKRKEDAYILESDLETEDSGSEETYRKKQKEIPINPTPDAFDSVWSEGNETFLLKLVKGVSDLDGLRYMCELKSKVMKTIRPPVTSEMANYSVLNKPGNDGKQPRLKVRNVPIKPIMLKRNPAEENSPVPSRLNSKAVSSPVSGNLLRTVTSPVTTPRPQGNKVSGSPRMTLGHSASKQSPTQQKTATNNLSKQNSAGNLNQSSSSTTTLGNGSVGSYDGKEMPTDEAKTAINSTTEVLNPTESTSKANDPQEKKKLIGSQVKNSKTVPVQQMDEALYCLCQGPHDNVSKMIGCDDKDCKYQWFHFECVGIVVPPKGRWYCPVCSEKRKKSHPTKSRRHGVRNGVNDASDMRNISDVSIGSSKSNNSTSSSQSHSTNCSSLLGHPLT